jgi:putative ABC transport system permease protein
MTIASFRLVDWRSPAFNFRIIASPGVIEAAPQSYFTTLSVADGTDGQVETQLLDTFPALTFVPVRDALNRAQDLLADISTALALVGATSLVAGVLVLASALGVGRRQREADAVVMKILGARRATVILAFLLEYAAIGAITAAIATSIALAGAWAVSSWLLDIGFAVRLELLATVALSVIVVTAATGAVTTWSAMSRTPAKFIRDAEIG